MQSVDDTTFAAGSPNLVVAFLEANHDHKSSKRDSEADDDAEAASSWAEMDSAVATVWEACLPSTVC